MTGCTTHLLVFLLASAAGIIATGLFTFIPIANFNSRGSSVNGSCQVVELLWERAWCDASQSEYDVPVIVTRFQSDTFNVTDFDDLGREEKGFEDEEFEGLFLDQNREDKTTPYKATIFDGIKSQDGEETLVRCQWSNFIGVTTKLLADHVPSLLVQNGTTLDSAIPLEDHIYPDDTARFECTLLMPNDTCRDNENPCFLFLTYKAPSKSFLKFLFAVCIIFHLYSGAWIARYLETDQCWATPFRVYGMLLTMWLTIPFIIIWLPCKCFYRDEAPDSPFELMEAWTCTTRKHVPSAEQEEGEQQEVQPQQEQHQGQEQREETPEFYTPNNPPPSRKSFSVYFNPSVTTDLEPSVADDPVTMPSIAGLEAPPPISMVYTNPALIPSSVPGLEAPPPRYEEVMEDPTSFRAYIPPREEELPRYPPDSF